MSLDVLPDTSTWAVVHSAISAFRSVQGVQTHLYRCPVGDDYEKCSVKSQSMLVFITVLLFAASPLRVVGGMTSYAMIKYVSLCHGMTTYATNEQLQRCNHLSHAYTCCLRMY